MTDYPWAQRRPAALPHERAAAAGGRTCSALPPAAPQTSPDSDDSTHFRRRRCMHPCCSVRGRHSEGLQQPHSHAASGPARLCRVAVGACGQERGGTVWGAAREHGPFSEVSLSPAWWASPVAPRTCGVCAVAWSRSRWRACGAGAKATGGDARGGATRPRGCGASAPFLPVWRLSLSSRRAATEEAAEWGQCRSGRWLLDERATSARARRWQKGGRACVKAVGSGGR